MNNKARKAPDSRLNLRIGTLLQQHVDVLINHPYVIFYRSMPAVGFVFRISCCFQCTTLASAKCFHYWRQLSPGEGHCKIFRIHLQQSGSRSDEQQAQTTAEWCKIEMRNPTLTQGLASILDRMAERVLLSLYYKILYNFYSSVVVASHCFVHLMRSLLGCSEEELQQ